MLGNYIRVTVMPAADVSNAEKYSDSEVRLIHGVAGELGAYGKPAVKVYIFSTTSLKGYVKLRVIGIITEEKSKEIRYVVAPDRVVIFEPQIRTMLAEDLKGTNYEMTCLYEKSCGAVIFRRRSGNLEFLLVKNRRGGNWGFPKGHIEIGESEQETAAREVMEETGLKVRFIEGFRVISEYHPRGKIFKQVVFFLAEMPDGGGVIPQPSEIDRCIWADYGLAIKTFRFNNDRNVLTKARDWLRRS